MGGGGGDSFEGWQILWTFCHSVITHTQIGWWYGALMLGRFLWQPQIASCLCVLRGSLSISLQHLKAGLATGTVQ